MLMRTLQLKDSKMFELLLYHNADITIPDVRGDTVLHHIFREGDIELFSLCMFYILCVPFFLFYFSVLTWAMTQRLTELERNGLVPIEATKSQNMKIKTEKLFSAFEALDRKGETPFGSAVSRFLREKKKLETKKSCLMIIKRCLALAASRPA